MPRNFERAVAKNVSSSHKDNLDFIRLELEFKSNLPGFRIGSRTDCGTRNAFSMLMWRRGRRSGTRDCGNPSKASIGLSGGNTFASNPLAQVRSTASGRHSRCRL